MTPLKCNNTITTEPEIFRSTQTRSRVVTVSQPGRTDPFEIMSTMLNGTLNALIRYRHQEVELYRHHGHKGRLYKRRLSA